MIFYGFLLQPQLLGNLFVLKMLLPAHAVDGLSLLGHVLHYHVDKQLGILGHDFLMRRGDVGTLVGQGIDVYRNHSFGGNIIDNGIFRQYKQVRIEVFDFCEFLALLPNFLKDNLAHIVGITMFFSNMETKR